MTTEKHFRHLSTTLFIPTLHMYYRTVREGTREGRDIECDFCNPLSMSAFYALSDIYRFDVIYMYALLSIGCDSRNICFFFFHSSQQYLAAYAVLFRLACPQVVSFDGVERLGFALSLTPAKSCKHKILTNTARS